jgi:hypothetical protein
MGIAAYNRGTKAIIEFYRQGEDDKRKIEDCFKAIGKALELEEACRELRSRIAEIHGYKGFKGAYIDHFKSFRGYKSLYSKVTIAEENWRNSPGPEKRPFKHLELVQKMHTALVAFRDRLEKEIVY